MAEQKQLDLKFSGLWTSTNPLSEAPEGAFAIADNVVLRDPALVEPRRGYAATAAIPSGNGIARVFPWQKRLLCIDAYGAVYDYSAATGWSSAYGPNIQPPDSSTPVRTAAGAKSLFATSSKGVRTLDGLGHSFMPAGILPPAVVYASPSSFNLNVYPRVSHPVPSGSYLAAGASVAYKVVLCRYDANNNLVQSASSDRVLVTNSGQTQSYAAGSLTKANGTDLVIVTSPAAHNLTDGQSVTVALNISETHFAAGTFLASVISTTSFAYHDGLTNTSGASQTSSQTDTIGAAQSAVEVVVTLPYNEGVTGQATFAQLYRTFSVPFGGIPSDEYFLIAEHVITPAELAYNPLGQAFGQFGWFGNTADITPDTFLTEPLYSNANSGTGQGENTRPPLARDITLFDGQMLYANSTGPQTLNLQLIGTQGLTVGTSIVNIGGVAFKASFSEWYGLDTDYRRCFKLYTTGTPAQNIENTARSLCKIANIYFSCVPGLSTRVALYYTSGATDAPGMITIQEQGVGGAPFTVSAGQDGQYCWKPDLSLASYTSTSDPDTRPNRIWWSPTGLPWSVPSDNWVDVGAGDQPILRVVPVRSTLFIFKTDGLWAGQIDSNGALSVTPLDGTLVLLAPESPVVLNNAVHCLTNRGALYVSESGVSPRTSAGIERDLNTVQSQASQYVSTCFGVPYENEGLYLLAVPTGSGDQFCSQQYVLNTFVPGWTRWLLAGARHGALDPTTNALVWAVGNTLWRERKTFASADIQDPGGAAIPCYVKLLSLTGGDPLHDKRIAATFWTFLQAEFSSATVAFDTDRLNTSQTVPLNIPTTFGWGTGNFGGLPFAAATRNVIYRCNPPQSMAECSQLGLTLSVSQAAVFWQLAGLAVLFEPTTALVRR